MRDHASDHPSTVVAVANGWIRLSCAIDGDERSIHVSEFSAGRQVRRFVVAHEDCRRLALVADVADRPLV